MLLRGLVKKEKENTPSNHFHPNSGLLWGRQQIHHLHWFWLTLPSTLNKALDQGSPQRLDSPPVSQHRLQRGSEAIKPCCVFLQVGGFYYFWNAASSPKS